MEALFITVVVVALIFEYTNGFHDAANAIATSIATRALQPWQALLIGGAVAYLFKVLIHAGLMR